MSDANAGRLTLFKVYRRTVAKRYRSLVHTELDQVPDGPLHVSPKVDGQLWFIDAYEGGVTLRTHSGRTLDASVPVVSELASTLGTSLQDTIIGFKPDPPEAIVLDEPTPTPRASQPIPHLEPKLTDSPAFMLLMWTLIGLMVGIAWTL